MSIDTIDTIELAAKAVRLAKYNYTAAIILAAGSSTRMGLNVNKQFERLRGIPVLAHTLKAYENCPVIREIIVVSSAKSIKLVEDLVKAYGITKVTRVVAGGQTRQASAICGLRAVSDKAHFVAIADGARCLTTPMQIANVCLHAYRHNAASAAHKVTDTIKRANAAGMSQATVDRAKLWQAQTPQVFHTALYTAALHRAVKERFVATDDNALIENLGYRVCMVECGLQNIKITTPDDLPLAEAILAYREAHNQ